MKIFMLTRGGNQRKICLHSLVVTIPVFVSAIFQLGRLL
jgi:hypothetical protein